MANHKLSLFFVASLVGCGADPVPPVQMPHAPDLWTPGPTQAGSAYSDGSRIAQIYRYTTSMDGYLAKVPLGLHDKMLNLDCAPMLAEDGVTRCLPISGFQQTSYFADSRCTQALVSIRPCVPLVSVAAIETAGVECSQVRYAVYEIGNKSIPYYESGGADCTAVSTVPHFYDYYILKGKRQATDYTAMTVVDQ